jgi:hypothetical protein
MMMRKPDLAHLQFYGKGKIKMKVSLLGNTLLLFVLMLTTTLSYALPFNVVPKPGTALPTSYSPGQVLYAYYTVTNSTGTQRNNNYTQYLPPNVSQITSGGTYSDTCGSSFNLGRNGAANDSCTLQLDISGPVNNEDPDQTHHLFVCFPGGKTCAGTNYPLNITQSTSPLISISLTPVSPTIMVPATRQFTATGTYANGFTQNISTSATWNSSNPIVATISSTGLARAISAGTTNITATQGGITSPADVLTVTKQLLSITVTPATETLYGGNTQQMDAMANYADGTHADVTNQATWASANVTDAVVSATGLVTVKNGIGNNAVNITASFSTITSTPAVITTILTLYAACNLNGGATLPTLSVCNINPVNGTTSSCVTVNSSSNGFRAPEQVAANADGSVLFGSSPNNNVAGCPLSGNSPSNSCTTTFGIGGTNSGIIIDNANHAYVSAGGNVEGCTASGTSLTACAAVGAGGTAVNIALNPAATILYVPNNNNVSYCPLSNGVIGTCITTTSNPGASNQVAIDAKNGFAYVVTGTAFHTAGHIFTCNLNATSGDLTNCTQTGSGLTFGAGIQGTVIDPSGTYIYISDLNLPGNGGFAYVCTLNPTGTVTSSNCTGIGVASSCGVTALAMK